MDDEPIEINGNLYHARDGVLVLDEDGKPIPDYVCICSAWCKSECLCGAWDYEE